MAWNKKSEEEDRSEYIKLRPYFAGLTLGEKNEEEPIIRQGDPYWQGVHYRSGLGVLAIPRLVEEDFFAPPSIGQSAPTLEKRRATVVAVISCCPVTGRPYLVAGGPSILRLGAPPAPGGEVKSAPGGDGLGQPAPRGSFPSLFTGAAASTSPVAQQVFSNTLWSLRPDPEQENGMILRRVG